MLRFTTASATPERHRRARRGGVRARRAHVHRAAAVYLPPTALDAYATSLLKVGWRETLTDEPLGACFAGAAFFTPRARRRAPPPLGPRSLSA